MPSNIAWRIAGTSILALAHAHAQLAQHAKIAKDFGQLPMTFEANQGQTDARVKFFSRGPGYTMFLTPNESVMETGAAGVLRIALEGADSRAQLSGIDRLAGESHYLIGSDPSRWHTGVEQFAKVKYAGVYPGIDLIYYGNPRDLEYDFVVAPGADPGVIAFSLSGARKLKTTPPGDLVFAMAGDRNGGEMRLHRPVIYQEDGGARRPVAGAYEVRGNRVSFHIAEYDRTRPLIIDPTVTFSTYLGGNGTDFFSAIQVDSSNNIYVTGTTNSTNFPTTSGALHPKPAGGRDAFVTKLAPDGKTIVFSTYLGGSSDEFSSDLALGPDGSIYVTGLTASKDFPVVNPYQTSLSGNNNGFLSRLQPDGSALMFSTYFGGSGTDFSDKVAVGSDGSAYVIGITSSPNFPVKGPFETGATPSSTNYVGFVTKFSATGSLAYASLMGFGNEGMGGITVDAAGNAYVVGETPSAKFPVTAGAFITTAPGPTPGFVSKINPAGSALVWSTYLGGSGQDSPCCVALDSVGNVFVAGRTTSSNFPVLNSLQAKNAGKNDAFLAVLKPDGSGLTASTYYGGNGDEFATDLTLVSGSGGIVIGGNEGGTLPGAGPPPNSNNTTSLVRIDDFFSTPSGNVTAIVTGTTNSTNLPLNNPVQATLGTACSSQPCTNNFVAAFNVTGVGPLTSATGNLRPLALQPLTTGSTISAGNSTLQGSGKNETPPKSKPVTTTSCNSLTVTPASSIVGPSDRNSSLAIGVITGENCNWSAALASAPNWLGLFGPATGTGPGVFSVNVSGNNTGSLRSATINVTGDGGSAIATVSQEAASCSYTWLPQAGTSIYFPLFGGQQTLSVTTASNCSWTAAVFDAPEGIPGLPSGWVTVSPTSGAGSGTVTLTAGASATNNRGFIDLTSSANAIFQQGPPNLSTNGTVNSSFNPNAPPSSGGIAATFGSNLAGDTLLASTIPLPTSLLGTSVALTTSAGKSVNAPLFFVSPGQINFQIPWEVAGQTSTTVTVTTGSQSSTPQTLTLGPVGPGIFTVNAQGTGQGIVTNALTGVYAAPSGSISGATAAPVHAGDYITIYATGLGPVSNQPASGAAGPSGPLASTVQPVTVTIGGTSGPAAFAGLAPGFVGAYQVNAQVPAAVSPGNAVPVTISVGGMTSNVATFAVQ